MAHFGPIGVDGKAAFERPCRLFELTHALKSQAEVVEIGGVAWIESDRLTDVFHGQIATANLERHHSQAVPGIGMLRSDLQHLAIKLFGLWQTAGLVMGQSQLQGFVNSRHARRHSQFGSDPNPAP